MRAVRWKRARLAVLGLIVIWFLNYNSALGRWDSAVRQCEFSADFVTSKNALGWATAEHRAHTQAQKDPTQHQFVPIYHSIHKSLDHYLSIPCSKKIRHPSLLTGR